jgi:hypothetical protein
MALRRMFTARWSSRVLLGACAAVLAMVPSTTQGQTHVPVGAGIEQVDHIRPSGTVDLRQLAAAGAPAPRVRVLSLGQPGLDSSPHYSAGSTRQSPGVPLGGANAPASNVASGGDNGAFDGITNIDMETGGTGNYANSNGVLEPPDMGLCAGAGFVIQAVNDSLRVYTMQGRKTTPVSIPLAEFFQRAAGGITGPTDFISDPRCLFDQPTQRWFVTILDLTSVPAYPSFADDQNFIAVSKTSDPTGAWNIFKFDVTDNGLNGSPLHPGCVGPPLGTATLLGCLGDQPTLGADANGIYITDNEYAFSEVFPVAPPVVPPLQQIPVLRSGVAQLYALSKAQLVGGTQTTLVRFDSNTVAFPGPAEDSPWQSISPAQPVPGDTTPAPAGGVEYFLSSVGLPVGHDVNQIVAWAWLDTASLNSSNPDLALQHVIIDTAGPSDTFFAPDPSSAPFAAYQKDGPHPQAQNAGDPEEYLNANDDRMNWVMLSNGSLWTGVNTQLPPTSPGATGHAGDNRVGIMYFQVAPSVVGGTLHAAVVRDGYVQVPDNNVLFPSVAPRADGATVITFTLAGIDNFPSVAWARVDGLSAGEAPVVHIARRGVAPEDGFTGLGLLGGQGIGLPDVPPCGPCVARWGDYSATEIDENGCVWGSVEDIPTGEYDSLKATNWGTGIFHVCPPPVRSAAVAGTTTTVTPAPTAASSGNAGAAAIALPNTAGAPPSGVPAIAVLAALAGLVALPSLRRRRRR